MLGAEAPIQAVEVRLLGPLDVSVDGLSARTGPKPGALLAALALEAGRVVPVDLLVEALWPGTPPDTAQHAVQVYVSQLRKSLGAGAVVRRGAGYALELEADRVDAHRFVRLVGEGREVFAGGDPASASAVFREALALWRGPALADFAYEPFAQTEIARLEELRLDAVEARIDADLALGRHADLVPELEAFVQSQPLREHPRAQLMLTLYRSGRQAEALAAYRSARDTLVEELGIEPGHELRELEAAILRHDESLLLPETAPALPAMQFRRLVTVLFVDVVESMALAEALDAEALGVVLRRYSETVSAAIARHGGTVEKYAGDAVMAAFGVPTSHEDDALRAARAALDVRLGIATLNEQIRQQHGVGLEVRIGLEAGEVVATATAIQQRLVTGEAVGIAAKLEQAAGADEIVVGEVAARLIDHVAELEPLGEMAVKGKREPVRAYRLLRLTPIPSAFERPQDVRLVGRKRELQALRRGLKRSADRSAVRVALVVGPPGVGKSRLAAELMRRAKSVTALWGRCLSYGEGITYWPLREVLDRASASEELDAVRSALEADTSPPAAEIAWLFRAFCEASARERPLVLVFDDVHWAEPTFLELVEHLADKGEGPIAVVCLAREELLEDRPAFLEGRENVDRILLDPLASDETDALLESLGGAILESDQRDRIVETAEGNPLFLEQLLALALEGGLGERPLPETIQALLAARLDRLGPGERAVLERGAVVGKEFTAADVVALLEPDAVPTADAHVQTLVGRGFVRPHGDGAFAFRHVLVQEAVYRSAPKRLRAELHERYADLLDNTYPDLPDLDEFVGYHHEQALRLRIELGQADAHTRSLSETAGRRLGVAGIRAFQRGDVPASLSLLGRATSLLPVDDPLSRELRCNLGIALNAAGDADRAIAVLSELLVDSRRAADERMEAWARLEREYVRSRRESRPGDELLEAAARGIPIFERVGDQRALGRAWLFTGWVHGGHWSNHGAWADAAERALAHYRAAPWPTSTCLGELAAALYWGPTPVDEAVARFEQLLQDPSTDIVGAAYVRTMLGGVLAQRGQLDQGREMVESARVTLAELGQRVTALTYCATVRGEIELLAGVGPAAEEIFRGICEGLAKAGDFSQLASRSSDLAEALVLQDRLAEAEEQTEIAERHAADDDVNAQMMWRSVRARILAHRGDFTRAEGLAREGVAIADGTDDLNRRAEAHRDLGDVLRRAGRTSDAVAAFARAVELFELKGNVVGAAHTRSVEAQPLLV